MVVFVLTRQGVAGVWLVARVWLVCGSTTAARHLAAAAAATSLDPPRSAATSSSSALWARGPGLLPGYIGATPQYSIIILNIL